MSFAASRTSLLRSENFGPVSPSFCFAPARPFKEAHRVPLRVPGKGSTRVPLKEPFKENVSGVQGFGLKAIKRSPGAWFPFGLP